MKRVMQVMSLAAMLMGSAAMGAEVGQQEDTSGWLLDANTQNWTCSVFAGKKAIGTGSGVAQCKARTIATSGTEYRQHLAFVYAQPVKVWNGSAYKYYFYVQEWGAAEGPGSECAGDSVMIFEVPYSADGALARNGVKPIYRGTANPCDTGVPHWLFDSAMADEYTGGVTLIGQKNVYDTKAQGAFREIWIAESRPEANGSYGKYFTWSMLFNTAITDHAVYHLHIVPDAGGATWRGFLEHDNGITWGSTPFILDRAGGTFRYKVSPTEWKTVPIGGTITLPPWFEHSGFLASFVKVNGRYELWSDAGGTRSYNKPMSTCNQTAYTWNVEAPPTGGMNRAGANAPRYMVYDVNLNAVTTWLPLWSGTHPVPTDEKLSVAAMRPANMAGLTGSTMYYGSNDWAVCNIRLTNWGFWSGSGIRWGRLWTVKSITSP